MAKPKVLLVEDDSELRNVLEDHLKELGCFCKSARDGHQALDILSLEDAYTCVISDIRMPNMDGMKMIQKMKEKKIKTPVIFITGYNEYTDELIEKEGGVVVIHKPFNYEQVSEIVKRYIKLLPVA